ncbi:hypothetical protein RvY_16948 [Ramazzottius varieornatus]|uniref:G-protein coupled receptors family 1 profile domain-containing protein n=1 Tax=Ramazzottius varieornatus TaxID=947166 RepID=A0A1D1W0C8_RAMVA|nr:hypothetical protein RvY_16948 [Ramazzottius varieornatus]
MNRLNTSLAKSSWELAPYLNGSWSVAKNQSLRSFYSPFDPVYFSLWFALAIVTTSVGIVTNSALIYACYKDRVSHHGPRYIIGNMALTSLAYTSIFLPAMMFSTYVYYSLNPHIVPNICLLYPLNHVTQNAATWAEVALAANRIIAICFPLKYDRWVTKRSSLCMIAIVWAISIAIVALFLLHIGAQYVKPPNAYACLPTIKDGFGVFLSFATSNIPHSLVAASSVVIFGTAVYKLRISRSVSPQSGRLVRKRLVIAKAMGVSVVWWCVCSLPWTIFVAIRPDMIVIFFTISAGYRKTIRALVCDWCGQRQQVTPDRANSPVPRAPPGSSKSHPHSSDLGKTRNTRNTALKSDTA